MSQFFGYQGPHNTGSMDPAGSSPSDFWNGLVLPSVSYQASVKILEPRHGRSHGNAPPLPAAQRRLVSNPTSVSSSDSRPTESDRLLYHQYFFNRLDAGRIEVVAQGSK